MAVDVGPRMEGVAHDLGVFRNGGTEANDFHSQPVASLEAVVTTASLLARCRNHFVIVNGAVGKVSIGITAVIGA